MQNLTSGISYLLHAVNLILFALLLVHLITVTTFALTIYLLWK